MFMGTAPSSPAASEIQRLAQRFQDVSGELRQLVQDENAEPRKAVVFKILEVLAGDD